MLSPPAPGLLPSVRFTGPAPFALLNDEPVSDGTPDLLGAGRAADRLAGLLIASRAAAPFTLAVDAGWGMGKSSLMRLVDARLRRHTQVHTVWYNAWTSTGADALEGLIKSVLMRLDPSILRRSLRRMREHGALLRFARALTVLAAGPLGVAGLVDELWRALSVDAGARNGMRDALREVLGEWTAAVPPGAPGRLLVVFVDDLDRCSEQTVLAVCEAVKVYLDVPGLAFVIGCDRAAVGPGGLLRDLSPAGTAFMEKIFQTSYRIPGPNGPDIQAYVRWCAENAGIDHLLDDHLVELLAYRAARNPRRVKRLVNGLLLEASLNPIWDGDDIRPEAVIRTLLLQYLYPDFYRRMTLPAGPGDTDVVQEFRSYRSIRRSLWSLAEWTPATADTVGGFLRTYAVRPLDGAADRSRALADLEQQLPAGFVALAGDPAFTSLVDELVELPESQMVLRRLREGRDDPVPGSGRRPPRLWEPVPGPGGPGGYGYPPPGAVAPGGDGGYDGYGYDGFADYERSGDHDRPGDRDPVDGPPNPFAGVHFRPYEDTGVAPPAGIPQQPVSPALVEEAAAGSDGYPAPDWYGPSQASYGAPSPEPSAFGAPYAYEQGAYGPSGYGPSYGNGPHPPGGYGDFHRPVWQGPFPPGSAPAAHLPAEPVPGYAPTAHLPAGPGPAPEPTPAAPLPDVIITGFAEAPLSRLRTLLIADARLVVPPDDAALRAALALGTSAVLLCDLDRGRPDAPALLALRASGALTGPVVIHTARSTPALRADAERLGAPLTDELAAVVRLVRERLPARPGPVPPVAAAPSDRPAPGSAGPPP